MKPISLWPLFALWCVLLSTPFVAHIVSGKPAAQSKSGSVQEPKQGAKGPDCSGSWPTNMAFARLKNEGITDNQKIDFSKTQTKRIASEKIGKDLYHQVYDVVFTERAGQTIEAIVVHDASSEECSMTGIELFVVSQHLYSK
jgi:hypothetical protein